MESNHSFKCCFCSLTMKNEDFLAHLAQVHGVAPSKGQINNVGVQPKAPQLGDVSIKRLTPVATNNTTSLLVGGNGAPTRKVLVLKNVQNLQGVPPVNLSPENLATAKLAAMKLAAANCNLSHKAKEEAVAETITPGNSYVVTGKTPAQKESTLETENLSDDDVGFKWNSKSVTMLLRLWQEHQEEGSVFTNKKKLFDTIAKKITETLNFRVTGEQCDNKFRNLKKIYRKTVDDNKQSGNGKSTCAYFDILQELHGKKPDTIPLAVTDGNGTTRKREPPAADQGDVKSPAVERKRKVRRVSVQSEDEEEKAERLARIKEEREVRLNLAKSMTVFLTKITEKFGSN